MEQRKHYNTLTEYYQKKWKCKVAKIALNASFTCPNRDGTKGWGIIKIMRGFINV